MGREEREGIILLLYPPPLSPRPPTDNTHTNILSITICLKKKNKSCSILRNQFVHGTLWVCLYSACEKIMERR